MDPQIIDANTMFGAHPAHRLDLSIERLVREMDQYRIAASLTLSTIGVFYNHVKGNASTLEAAKANPRLVPIATLNPQSYFGDASELQNIRSEGFRIFKFYPAEQGWPIDSAAFREALKQLAGLKSPVMVDAGRPGEPTAVGRMAADYPAPVTICSVSGESLSEVLVVASEVPSIFIETHELHVPGALGLLSNRIGSERIIFGSGAPRRSVASSLHYILSSELPDADKQLVLGGNIRRILEAT